MNPFISNKEFNLKVLSIYNRKFTGKDTMSLRETTDKFMVETQKKISIYKTGNSQDYTRFLFSLNKAARDIFLYMIANIGENMDRIKLDQTTVCTAIGISRNTYYNGLDDLKDNMVITPFKRAEFWVNPFILFRGDRIQYYYDQCPECIEVIGKKTTGDSLVEIIKQDQ